MRRLTTQWVRKAEADWEVVSRIQNPKAALLDIICFHCQQTAEKYLKALLQERGLVGLRTHNLLQLVDLLVLGDSDLKLLSRACKSLSRFAVDYRYPGTNASSRQAQTAVRLAERIRKVIRQRLGLTK